MLFFNVVLLEAHPINDCCKPEYASDDIDNEAGQGNAKTIGETAVYFCTVDGEEAGKVLLRVCIHS